MDASRSRTTESPDDRRGRLRVTVDDAMEDPEWDRFVARAGGGDHTQTSAWARVKAEQGWRPLRIIGRDGNAITCGTQLLYRRAAPFIAIGYMDNGPLVDVSDPEKSLDRILDPLETTMREHGIRILVAAPPPDTIDVADRLSVRGFAPSRVKTKLTATTVVDLDRTPDEILGAMRSKTRYNVRLAGRSGILVREGGKDDVPGFHAMLESTAERQGFQIPSLTYFRHLYEVLDDVGYVRLFVAEADGEVVSSILTVPFGDRVLYKRGAWGGGAASKRPNEALHWEAIKWARTAGHLHYDFDGLERDVAEAVVADPEASLSGAQGVTRFKLGFGGRVVLRPLPVAFVPGWVTRFAHDSLYPRVSSSPRVRRLVARARNGRS